MEKLAIMRIFCAFITFVLISWLGFSSLPLLQQTGGNFGLIVVAVLSGPILGTVFALINGTFISALPVLVSGFVICASCIFWYRKRRTFWSFFVASLSWAMTGLLLSVGIYV